MNNGWTSEIARLQSELDRLKDELIIEKTHSATSDFCLSEWKNDCDELRALLLRAVEIIETVNPGSAQEKEEQFLFLEDAKAVLQRG